MNVGNTEDKLNDELFATMFAYEKSAGNGYHQEPELEAVLAHFPQMKAYIHTFIMNNG